MAPASKGPVKTVGQGGEVDEEVPQGSLFRVCKRKAKMPSGLGLGQLVGTLCSHVASRPPRHLSQTKVAWGEP